jgi:hypothetical protein
MVLDELIWPHLINGLAGGDPAGRNSLSPHNTHGSDLHQPGGSGERVYDYIRLVVADTRYLDMDAEWRIIDNAVFKLGMMPMDVKSYLLGAAALGGFSTESMIVRVLCDIATAISKRSSRVSRDQFEHMVETAIALSQGELSKDSAENLAKSACEGVKLRARRRWVIGSRGWYNRISPPKAQDS